MSDSFKIWIDADACPKVIKEILYKTAVRLQIKMIFVSNSYLNLPFPELISLVVVDEGLDKADEYITQNVNEGELVVTADIPLANFVVEKKAIALNPRGQLYDQNNVKELLSIRSFMHEVRSSGVKTGGPITMSDRDKMNFSNALNKYLTKKGIQK